MSFNSIVLKQSQFCCDFSILTCGNCHEIEMVKSITSQAKDKSDITLRVAYDKCPECGQQDGCTSETSFERYLTLSLTLIRNVQRSKYPQSNLKNINTVVFYIRHLTTDVDAVALKRQIHNVAKAIGKKVDKVKVQYFARSKVGEYTITLKD